MKLHIPTKAALIEKSEHFFHMTYLGAVSWEAHGLYSHAAQALLVVTIIHIFIKGDVG